MANPYVTGPAWIYVSLPAAATPVSTAVNPLTVPAAYFLGSCETPPQISFNPQYEAVMNDWGGAAFPIDYTYQGQDGMIQGVLNKWNESVYAALADKPFNAGTRGTDLWNDIGTMMQLEGGTFHVWVQFPYYSKIYGTSFSMPRGYHFPACRWEGEGLAIGSRSSKRQFLFHADRVVVDAGTTAGNKVVLFDHDFTTTAIPSVPPSGSGGT